ncbi:NADP-dependent oxidoreductase domain-containing protein [Talaromyces proteolyticus]|uniref:NADP-dependent oxidoreductase domain-containing protein n=1 Tax=Talaromyces proteolyticus TaxID=1131652 RepID=A0AAD4KR45_9EURO|nr:NADP-dependent oxidoreductase domain-containing protein [Talaromyces proteolyticus]KAH8698585.1 NADP-dependent oxidoreductase domain-containing protein [Talaromyces proteolyticus]
MPEVLGKQVGPIGFGLMGLTWRDTPCPQEQAFETMRTALKNGDNYWNGGEFYGPVEYNSLVLLERYFEKYPEDADKVVLNIKGGSDMKTGLPDGSPQNTRRTLDDCIAQLKGRKKIDMFEFARRDQKVPMEITFDVMQKEYIQTGKLGGIALSEVRAETIHEAVKHIKVLAVEVELSLFSTDPLENGVAAACAQYGIPLIAYSPIGRGMLTGQFKKFEDIPKNSNIRRFPRFQPGNFEINVQLVEQVEKLAEKKGCTPAQFAINWTLALSRRPGMPTIIPIPGATTAARVNENSKLVNITDEEMAEIDATLAKFTTAGERYPDYVPMNT